MIGKIVQGKSFRGLLNYLHGKEGAQCIGGNLAGETPREFAAEFRVARALNRRLKKAVCHVSLSLPKHERLADDQWLAIASDYIVGMGYEHCQYVVYRHHDQDHDHIHLAICRIRLTDGKTVSDAWEKRRAETLIRSLEQQYRLDPVQPSWEKLEIAPTTGEMRRFERTGELPVRVRLQAQIDQAAENSGSIAQLIHRLKAQGIEIRLRIAQNQRITGISYCLDQVAFSGSQLGRAYTFPGLQKHKRLHYDHATEFETTRQAADTTAPESGLDAAVVAEFEQIAERFRGAITYSGNRVDRNQAIPELSTTASSRISPLPTIFESTEPEPATNEYATRSDQSTSFSSSSNRQQPVGAANSPESRISIVEERDDLRGTESGGDSSLIPRLQPVVSGSARATHESRRQDGTTISIPDPTDPTDSASDSEQNRFPSETISERGSRDLSGNFGSADLFWSAGGSDRVDSATASTASQSEPNSTTGEPQRDSARTSRTRAADDFGETGNSATKEIGFNEDQQRWQRYSFGVQASNTVKLNALVARRAFEEGQSPREIARMLLYSPFVQEMVEKHKSSEKIQAYIRQTVQAACQKEQQQQRQQARSLTLEI